MSVGDVTRVEADIKPGTVLKQTHTPGSQVAVGTPVGFALAIPITVVVPDVVGYSERAMPAPTLNKARLADRGRGSSGTPLALAPPKIEVLSSRTEGR